MSVPTSAICTTQIPCRRIQNFKYQLFPLFLRQETDDCGNHQYRTDYEGLLGQCHSARLEYLLLSTLYPFKRKKRRVKKNGIEDFHPVYGAFDQQYPDQGQPAV